MKKIAAVVALSFAAMGAQAATYQLTNIILEVPFGTVNSDTSPNLNIVGDHFATLVGSDVSATAGWESLTPNGVYDYSGTWSTALGNGGSVIKLAEICNNDPGNPGDSCDDPRGLVGDWITGLLQNGNPCALGSLNCFVNVTVSGTTEVGVDTLQIVRRTEFQSCAANPTAFYCALAGGTLNFSQLTLTYTLIPVPAAVWFFASALGIMGFLRRRAQAA